MYAWHRTRSRIVVGIGLSVLCALPKPLPYPGRLIGEALANEGWEAMPGKAGCAAAPRLADEPVPELLALADWPLDKASVKHCAAALAPSGAEKLPPPVEIRVAQVKTVYAAGYDAGEGTPPSRSSVVPKKTLRQLAALDSSALDNIRGGFEAADSNLKFSFGFERVVYINGQLVASTVLSLRDLQTTSGGRAPASSMPPGVANGPAVVQNGAGNTFAVQAGQSVAGTVIQNTLNNQQIDTVTTISAVVNSAQVLRVINLQSAIRDTLVNSLRR